jgi:hypothetical protein
MGKGVLEVHLVDAKGLSGNDFLGACSCVRVNCVHWRVFLVVHP